MNLGALAVLVVAAASTVALAQQAAPANGAVTLRGRVTAENDAALPRVRLTLAGGDRRVEPVFTGDDGRFALTVPPELARTPLRLTTAKGGFAAFAVAVSPSDITARAELQVRLARGAAISGRVVDSAGTPIVDALVVAVADPAAPHLPLLAETDDQGQYRLGGLAAGRYAVTVMRTPTAQRDSPTRLSERLQANPAALSATAVSAATTVDLRAGDEAPNVDFITAPAPLPVLPQPVDPPSGGTGGVTGRVITTSGRPLAGAQVRLARAGMAARFAVTDADGRFAIREVVAGAYILQASREGYITLQYGQERTDQVGKTVSIRDAETLERIDIALPTGSAIAGTIVDDYGEPIAGATVRALQVRTSGDMTMAVSAPGVRERLTDDRGRYRLFGLLPGRYLVTASVDADVPSQDRQDAYGYAPVFYPGTSQVARAAQVQVDIGRDASDIDLVFVRSRTARITGFAYDASGQPLKTGVLLFESQRSGGIMLEPRKGGAGPDGSFTFTNVPPGDYVVQAIASRSAVPAATGRGGTPSIDFGMQYITVGDVDPPQVTIRLSPGATIEGRVVKEGVMDAGARFTVWPFPTDFDRSPVIGSGPAGLSMLEDGRFRVAGVTGPRRFVLGGAPSGWYLKSATVNGVDAADRPFDFGLEAETYRDVEIVLSSAGATITGRVIEEAAPISDYSVIAFSTDRESWFRNSQRLKLARPDQAGAFRVDALPPGDYWIAAVDRVEGTTAIGEWQDRGFLEMLSTRALRITVGEGQSRSIDLRLISQ